MLFLSHSNKSSLTFRLVKERSFTSMKYRGTQTCKIIQWSFRKHSVLAFSTHTHTHVQETSDYLLWCPQAPPIPLPHRSPPHLDLSSPQLPNLLLLLSTHRLPLTLLPARVPWVVWCQFLSVGCLQQVQTINMFVYVSVWFSNSLFMVRVLKGDIFMVIVAGLFYYIFM